MGELLLLTFVDETGSKKFMSQVDSAFGIERFLSTVAAELGLNEGRFALKLGEKILDSVRTFEQAGIASGTRLVVVPRPRETRILIIFLEPQSGRSRAVKVDSTQPMQTDLYSILEQLDIRRSESDPRIPPYSLKLKRSGKWIEGRTLQEAGAQEGDTILVVKHPVPGATMGAGARFLEAWDRYRKGLLPRRALDPLVGPALQDASADRVRICQAASRLRLPSAAPEMVRMLSLPDAKVRNSAIQGLARFRHSEALPRLASLLNDPASAGAAARALATLRAHSAVPRISDLLKNSEASARSGALAALAQFDAPAVRHSARDLLQDPDPAVRSAALQTLARVNDFEAVQRAARLLNDSDPDVRRVAVETVGLLGAEEIVADVAARLADPEPEVRAAALHALGVHEAKSCVPQMAPLLKDPESEVRAAACKAFGRLKAASALLSCLRRGEVEAIEPLGDLSVPEAIPDLRRFLKEEDDLIRWRAAHALAKLGNSEGLGVLLELLRNGDAHLRMLAGMSAGEFQVAQALPDLIALLSDDDPGVREGVALEIGAFRAPEAVPPLLALLTDDFAPIRAAAGASLHAMNAREAVPAAVKLLDHDRFEARVAALVLLNRMNDAKTTPEIVPLAEDPEPAVRIAAIAALGEMAASSFLPQILLKLRDPHPDVRAAAAEAACRLGSREGVEGLFAGRRPLFALNALRQPELWSKLRSIRYPKNTKAPAHALIDEMAAATGLEFQSDVARTGRCKEWLSSRIDLFGEGGALSWLDGIAAALVEGPYEVILEPGRVHLLSRDRAEAFWKDAFGRLGSA